MDRERLAREFPHKVARLAVAADWVSKLHEAGQPMTAAALDELAAATRAMGEHFGQELQDATTSRLAAGRDAFGRCRLVRVATTDHPLGLYAEVGSDEAPADQTHAAG